MINEYRNSNPKALNLGSLKGKTSKVTLGFKCTPELKLKLADDAQDLGLTLSSYTEYLLEKSLQEASDCSQKQSELFTQLEEHKKQIQFYETPRLKSLFNELSGKEIPYLDINGNRASVLVSSLNDIYTIVINSFQISKS